MRTGGLRNRKKPTPETFSFAGYSTEEQEEHCRSVQFRWLRYRGTRGALSKHSVLLATVPRNKRGTVETFSFAGYGTEEQEGHCRNIQFCWLRYRGTRGALLKHSCCIMASSPACIVLILCKIFLKSISFLMMTR